MTENRPESPGSHRRCETAKLVVLQSKTSNNRSYQNLQLVIRCSRVRAAVDGLVLWVAQSSSPLPRSWLVLRTRSALTSLVRFAVTVDEVISRCRGRAASVRAASVRAASGALVPASTSGSRNTLAVSLFETRSIGEAVMAVCGSPDAKPIVTVILNEIVKPQFSRCSDMRCCRVAWPRGRSRGGARARVWLACDVCPQRVYGRSTPGIGGRF